MDSLISIIVPVYNVESYLLRCIESILNQTYTNIELILVNDGSTDTSGAICDEYAVKDCRVKVYHIANGGSSVARNYGLKMSKGDYIGFVDSDDWIQPNMYAELIKFAKENNLSVVETSSIESHLVKDNQKEKEINAVVEDKLKALKRVIRSKGFAVWRRMYQRSILNDLSFIEGILHQDVYYTLDILNKISHIGYFKNQFYVYNVQNPTSVIRSNYSIKKLNSINAAAYVVEHTTQYDESIQNAAKRYLFEFLTYHYDSLYYNSKLDKDGTHRKTIRRQIRKHSSIKNFHFYGYAIVILPPTIYKFFLLINKKRIKIQLKIIQLLKNV